ncbi:MAG TPA: hypothetical protein VND65_18075 [Candidatus Binatia bacterium]|nr:hypothetical protein [Candidatus Binatia bacterium]
MHIGVPDVRGLLRLEQKLVDAGITFFRWDEPDDDLGFTSIATVPLCGKIREVLQNYRLLKHRWPVALGSALPSKGGREQVQPLPGQPLS